MTLPIQIPELAPNQWRSLEQQLIAIATKEKAELEPRDRKVNNSLTLAQDYARKLQWGDLFRFLIERDIVKIGAAIAEPPPKPDKKPNAPRNPKVGEVQNDSIRNNFGLLLPQILYSDRAIGIQTILLKAKELGFEIGDRLCQEYLNQFAKAGFIFNTVGHRKYVAYSLKPTDLIDVAEWLPASIAYRIAVANGCKLSFQSFKDQPYKRNSISIAKFYAQYGIEYRFGHKPMENQKWRVLNGNAS